MSSTTSVPFLFGMTKQVEICERAIIKRSIPQKTLRKWFWSNKTIPFKTASQLVQLVKKIEDDIKYMQHIESIIFALLKEGHHFVLLEKVSKL